MNALVAQAYGIENEDLENILANDEDRLTGFYRVDDDLPWEERRTYKTIEYHRKLNSGEWTPSTDLKLPDNVGVTWSELETLSEIFVQNNDNFVKDMEELDHNQVWSNRLREFADDS